MLLLGVLEIGLAGVLPRGCRAEGTDFRELRGPGVFLEWRAYSGVDVLSALAGMRTFAWRATARVESRIKGMVHVANLLCLCGVMNVCTGD